MRAFAVNGVSKERKWRVVRNANRRKKRTVPSSSSRQSHFLISLRLEIPHVWTARTTSTGLRSQRKKEKETLSWMNLILFGVVLTWASRRPWWTVIASYADTPGGQVFGKPICHFKNEKEAELTFAKTSGTVTKDRENMYNSWPACPQ